MERVMNIHAPDLTKRPPRSPRVRLGGHATLPRVLDKCRATIAAVHGEFNFNCPLDQRWFEFAGIDAAALKREVAKGKSDGEMLAWINAHSKTKPSPAQNRRVVRLRGPARAGRFGLARVLQ